MLDLLNQKNTSDNYVTRQEIKKLISTILQMKKGRDGKDASITKELIESIAEKASPSRAKLVDIIKPLIPAPIKGEPGKDGRNVDDIDATVLMNKIKSVRGDGRLLIDNIKGGKRMQGEIMQLKKAVNMLGGNFEYVNERTDELYEFKEKIEGIEISLQSIGQGQSSVLINAANFDCSTNILTINADDGAGGTLDVTADLSCLRTKHICTTTNPTTEGSVEGYSNGSQWYNTDTQQLFTYMCGNWIEQSVVVPPTVQNLLTESGDTVLTEEGLNLKTEQSI